MEMENRKSNSNYILPIFIFTIIVAVALTLPVFTKVGPHADEYQFYFNAFKIMAGQELHNYLHVAFTEYLLAGFFSIVNIVTTSGVNFPQGDPSLATYFYGRIFGLIFYLAIFLLGVIILQKGENKLKPRSVVFSILYFGSIGVFERAFRANSDFMLVFVFLNFVILSFWFHKIKASNLKFFILNLLFIFIGTFTNFKFLYLAVPLVLINFILPFFVYKYQTSSSDQLSKLYKIILYVFILPASVLVLWAIFMPKPFNYIKYWYSIEKTIVHGTKFDFDYPGQSFGSWKVYIFDLFAEYLGFNVLLAFVFLLAFSYKYSGWKIISVFWNKFKKQFDVEAIKEGNIYRLTEVILLACFITYYLGVSTAVVHWSRWGVPLGVLAMLILSPVVEYLIFSLVEYKNKFNFTALILFSVFLAIVLRIFLTIDLYRSDFPKKDGWGSTYKTIDKFLAGRGISATDGSKKAAWFTGYTGNIGNFSLENIIDPINSEVKYIFWPYWNLTVLYSDKNVDLGTHNQRAIIDTYGKKVMYGFPTFISYYTHFIALVSNKYLRLTYIPEIEGMIEPQYGILELKETPKELRLSYDVGFKDMSHYNSFYSLYFNMKTLKDGYMYPPCYSYPDTVSAQTGKFILPPPEFGIGGRTAGLYCHSTRFRILLKGEYRIRVEGLPNDSEGLQRVFSNMAGYEWDPITKTITFSNPSTTIPGDFGVATKEKSIPNLKFRIFYVSD